MAQVSPVPVATEQDALLPKLDTDPEAQAGSTDQDDLDKPEIPGVEIQYILPALGLGVNSISDLPPLPTICFADAVVSR